MLWIGVSAPWPPLDPLPGVGVPPPSAPICTSFSLRRPPVLSLPLGHGSPSSSSVHSGALTLSFSRGRSPRYMDRRKSPSSLSYQQAALAHSDTAFILCPSHLRLAGDQPKCAPVHDQPFGRAGYGSYELAREPLAWGTRRKSIILNHGMIGSNDQTTARRASLRGDSRGRATSCLAASRRKDPVLPSTRSPSCFRGSLPLSN